MQTWKLSKCLLRPMTISERQALSLTFLLADFAAVALSQSAEQELLKEAPTDATAPSVGTERCQTCQIG